MPFYTIVAEQDLSVKIYTNKECLCKAIEFLVERDNLCLIGPHHYVPAYFQILAHIESVDEFRLYDRKDPANWFYRIETHYEVNKI